MTTDNIETARQKYADVVTADVSNVQVSVREAFASVPREHHLGPGPWSIFTFTGYSETASEDAVEVYVPAAIAIDSELGINNGDPKLHAVMLNAAAAQPGDRVLHVGAGAGYYTALLSEMVGNAGFVDAYEVVDSVARRAIEALSERENVKVHIRSGSEGEFDEVDVIYVCAGATRPAQGWLNALRPGGRLVFPLTPSKSFGGILKIERPVSPNDADYHASFICPAMFIPCEGLRGPEDDDLAEAFSKTSMGDVVSLRNSSKPDEDAWFVWSDDLWLSTKAL